MPLDERLVSWELEAVFADNVVQIVADICKLVRDEKTLQAVGEWHRNVRSCEYFISAL